MTQLYITRRGIIKPISVEGKYISGYNLLTEQLVKVNKKAALPMSKEFLAILGDGRSRYLVARASSETVKEMGQLLNITERTAHRMKEEFDAVEKGGANA